MGEGVSERLIRQVIATTVGSCGSCSHGYDEAEVSIVGRQEDLWFISLVCDHCQNRDLVAVLVRESDRLAVGDTHSEDPPSEMGRRVDAKDVRAVQQFLDRFDGDFQSLFG